VIKYKLEDYEIKFIEETHEYFVNGVKVECISDINKEVLVSKLKDIPEFVLKKAGARGDAVHRMIQFDLFNALDESTVDEKLKGYYDSYRLFKEGKVIEPLLVEKRMYNPEKNYCFTLDFYGKVDSLKKLWDWKTGSVYDEVKYKAQVGGQLDGLLKYGIEGINYCGCVQLFKNGKIAKEHVYNNEEILEDWKCVKRVYDLRRK
jgi:hypothetical protein